VIAVCNFTPVPRPGYRIGVPLPGFYRELINTDAAVYGGSGVGNLGGVDAEAQSWHGRDYSILVMAPPLGVVLFELEG
jgi:1,4-alpha-glucan branching enzyme